MATLYAKTNGSLSNFGKTNEGYTIQILGEDGLFHVYSKMSRVCKSDHYEAGNYVGEGNEAHYEVRGSYLENIKREKENVE